VCWCTRNFNLNNNIGLSGTIPAAISGMTNLQCEPPRLTRCVVVGMTRLVHCDTAAPVLPYRVWMHWSFELTGVCVRVCVCVYVCACVCVSALICRLLSLSTTILTGALPIQLSLLTRLR
jgi:hypothetical protein